MSRILEALKQIEARSIEPDSSESSPPDPVRDETAIESTLRDAEAAAAEALGESAVGSLPVGGPGPSKILSRIPVDQPEPYATLAGRIVAQLPTRRSSVLMFAEPGQTSGTGGIVSPLARAIASRMAGEVLLIDGDLRNPTLAGRFDIEPSRGLADVLTGMTPWEEVICPTDIPTLSIMPGVPFPNPPGGPPEHLNLERLLSPLRERFRLTLIATSALEYTEVAPMGRHCNGVYLLVRLNHTTHREARDAVASIRSRGGRVLGSLVVTS